MGSYGIYDSSIYVSYDETQLTACGGFDVSNKSDFLAERYVFILHNYVRTNLLNKTILSCDCLSVHELKRQWSVCPWDEEPQALSACPIYK